MAFQKSNGGLIPHATNYTDLLDKVVTFAVAQGWVIMDDQRAAAGAYIVLKGLDYSGTGAIYVAIKKYAAPGSDTYGWIFQGYTGLNGAGFGLEPGAIQGGYLPTLPLWNDVTPYWLSVNPRRILLVANVNGVYVSMYLGLFLPYGTQGQYQYPLVIGGNNLTGNFTLDTPRYSDTSGNMTSPFIPLTGFTSRSNLVVRDQSGVWVYLNGGNSATTMNGVSHSTAVGISPYNAGKWTNCRANQGGEYPLRTLRLMRYDTPDALGIIDGAKYLPGHLLSAEDTITVGGDTYTIFKNSFRTALDQWFCVKES